jgi:hypothetical protein
MAEILTTGCRDARFERVNTISPMTTILNSDPRRMMS